jgi:hypothetical protein
MAYNHGFKKPRAPAFTDKVTSSTSVIIAAAVGAAANQVSYIKQKEII